ncbi:hypothetical protein LAWI1_G000036 [Lachnellula willkommii]|uniref:Uncharacterized protein n=1 Tax=Lachnellula willkommii TaxID=215461 RepID=A0A559MN45_9HELO|nr:hypothetical protein LAWI1_G000036 [Lachnellula willkommii]
MIQHKILTTPRFLTPSTVANESYKAHSCPTVTKKTTSKSCPAPTPAFCAQPQCILLSVLDVPCGCPKTVSTETDYTPCTTGCHGACRTTYETNLLPCSSPTASPSPKTPKTLSTRTRTTKPIPCLTITKTTGPNCPTTCPVPDCIILSTVTNPCSCTRIVETTSCKTKCEGGCQTRYKTLLLPCPFTGPFPTSTPTPTPVAE